MSNITAPAEFRNNRVQKLVQALEDVLDDFSGPGLNNLEVVGALEAIKFNYMLGYAEMEEQ